MKKYYNNLLIILFPVILLSLYSILVSDIELNFNQIDNTTILNIIYIIIFILSLGSFINTFLIRKNAVNKIFVFISIAIICLFILPRVLLIYVPFIYNGVLNNYTAVATLSLIFIIIDVLIIIRK